MTNKEMLQYARDNYSLDDKISREGFSCNYTPTRIYMSTTPKENNPYFHGNSVFLGNNEIYCGDNGVWAKNLTRQNKTISNQEQYEIY